MRHTANASTTIRDVDAGGVDHVSDSVGKRTSGDTTQPRDPASRNPMHNVYVWLRDASAGDRIGRVMLMKGPFGQPLLLGFATPALADDFRSRHDLGSATLRTLGEARAAEGAAFPEASGLFVFTTVEQIRLWQRDKSRFVASIADQIRPVPDSLVGL